MPISERALAYASAANSKTIKKHIATYGLVRLAAFIGISPDTLAKYAARTGCRRGTIAQLDAWIASPQLPPVPPDTWGPP